MLSKLVLSLIHISEPTRLGMISYAVFCLKKKRDQKVFSVDPTARDMLLKGLDEIGLTEQSMDLVVRFEEQDQARRPWVYLPSD